MPPQLPGTAGGTAWPSLRCATAAARRGDHHAVAPLPHCRATAFPYCRRRTPGGRYAVASPLRHRHTPEGIAALPRPRLAVLPQAARRGGPPRRCLAAALLSHTGGGALHCCRADAPQRHRSDVAADTPVERQHTPRVAATLRRCRALGITTVSLSRPTSRAAARQGYLPRLRLAAAPPPYARGGVATLPLASRRCHTPEGAVTLSPCYRAAAKHQENRRNVA
jgi:hypothetical protein